MIIIMKTIGSSGDRVGSDDGLNGLADLAPSFVPFFFLFKDHSFLVSPVLLRASTSLMVQRGSDKRKDGELMKGFSNPV